MWGTQDSDSVLPTSRLDSRVACVTWSPPSLPATLELLAGTEKAEERKPFAEDNLIRESGGKKH